MTRARDIANFGDGIATADIGDGQITTAKIADGDVSAAKLASTLDLSGKTVTLPSGVGGTLVKVTTHTRSTTYESSSSSSSAPAELVQSHTMEDSNNKLYVFVAGVVGRGTTNGGIAGILKFDGNFLEYTKIQAASAIDNDRHSFGSAIIDGYTGAKTFEVHIASTTNNSKAQLVGGATLVIMEYTP